MLGKVKISSAVDTFQFFPAKREFKFDIKGCICVMCKLYMIMKP